MKRGISRKYTIRQFNMMYQASSATLRPASGASGGVPPGGSILGIRMRRTRAVTGPMLNKQTSMPIVTPMKGKPPSSNAK